MAEKKNEIAEYLLSRGVKEAEVPPEERGVTTVFIGLGRAAGGCAGRRSGSRRKIGSCWR